MKGENMKRKMSYLLILTLMLQSLLLQPISAAAANISDPEVMMTGENTENPEDTDSRNAETQGQNEKDGDDESQKQGDKDASVESPETTASPTSIPTETPEGSSDDKDGEISDPENTVSPDMPQETTDKTDGDTDNEQNAEATPTPSVVPQNIPEVKEEYVSANAGLVYQEGSFDVVQENTAPSSDSMEIVQAIDWNQIDAYLYQQFRAKKTDISLSEYKIPSSYAGTLVSAVVNEHPDLYAVDVWNTYTYYSTSGYCVKIAATYNAGYDDAAFQNAVNEALGSLDYNMDDMQKAITLHDYLVLNCEYYSDSSTFPDTVYDAYAALVDRKAVCQGYALAYKYLLNQAGVDCYMVTSSAMNHAWNLIALNGQYYQVDTTWDDPLQDRLGYARHKYMFVSDEAFQSSRDHYGWQVTYRNQAVNLVADDTTYDNAFWVDINSPFVIKDNNFYYVNRNTRKITKRGYTTGEESSIYTISDTWRPTGNSSSYYTGSYSGLFTLGDRLYFNTPDYVYSISYDGNDLRLETKKLSGASGSVYGITYREGLVYYVLYTEYKYSKETPLTTQLLNEHVVPVSKITVNPSEVSLGTGEEIQLEVQILPSTAAGRVIEWQSSNLNVATVEEGLVTAIGKGTCVITATVDGKQSACSVTVRRKTDNPIFNPAPRTIDSGESVTIVAEAGADIYYTMDGSEPALKVTKSTKKYDQPVSLTKDAVIKAVAILENEDPSEVVTAEYRVCTNNLLLDQYSVTLLEGEQKSIGVKEVPTLRDEKDIRWSSDTPQVALVDTDGAITAVREGTAIITAAVNDHKDRVITAEVEVTVEAPVYTVRFIGNKNAEPISVQSVKARRDAVVPEEGSFRVPNGYKFVGWKESYTNIQQNMDIHAEYETINYKINYELNDGVMKEQNPDTYTVESPAIELKNPVRDGYRFVGWYETEEFTGNSISVIESGSTGDLTLYAKWKDERGLWFKAEGASEDNVIPVQEYTGKAIKPVIDIYYGSELLDPKTDYSITYQNNIRAYLNSTQSSNNKKPTIQMTGKGNFAGKLVCNFEIAPKNISDEDIIIDNLSAAYNKGKYIKGLPQVYWNGKKLAQNKDYIVEYPDSGEGAYAEPGDYNIVIKAKAGSNFSGERSISFHITDPVQERLLSKVTIGKIADQRYQGKKIEFTGEQLQLRFQKESLVLGEDYEVIYSDQDDYTEIGTHEILIRGKGIYSGERRVKFKIVGQSIKGWKVTVPELVYNGEYQSPEIVVTDAKNNPVAEEGKDYTVRYEKNCDAGTAKVIITGIGSYTGTITKNCKIKSCNITNDSDFCIEFANGDSNQSYEKDGAKPAVIVTYKGNRLQEGKDYSLAYANNKSESSNAKKKPLITVTGKKNFTGKRTIEFSITKQNLAMMQMTAPDMVENKSAGKFFSTPVLTDLNGKKLQKGKDYETQFTYEDVNGTILSKKDCPKAGAVIKVTVTGKGNYEGTCSTTFRIIAKNMNISSAKVAYNTKFYYTGEPVTLRKEDIIVKMGKTVLSNDQFEIVEDSYVSNIKKGTAKVTIRGKGEYGGTKVISFSIASQSMKWWSKE